MDADNSIENYLGYLDFSIDPPTEPGVYAIMENNVVSDEDEEEECYLGELRLVFVKINADGDLYAVGENESFLEDEFYDYVWARTSEIN